MDAPTPNLSCQLFQIVLCYKNVAKFYLGKKQDYFAKKIELHQYIIYLYVNFISILNKASDGGDRYLYKILFYLNLKS